MAAAHRPRPALRLISFYAGSFAALAVWVAFWPLWLRHEGLTEQEVGALSTLLITARTLAGPFWGGRADRGDGPRPVLQVLMVLSLCCFLPFGFGGGFRVFVLWTVLFGCCYPPIHPLIDSLTMQVGRERGFAYGRVRLWGSLAFLLMTIIAGVLVERHGTGLVYPLIAATLGWALLASFRLPLPRTPPPRATGRPVRELLRSRPFLLFLLSAGMVMASHAGVITYGSIHWQKAGIGEGVIGLLVAEGVLAEILVFWTGAALVRRVPAERLLLLAALAGVVRWCVLGSSTALVAVAAVQWLHGFSFGALHLGCLQWIQGRIGSDRTTSAQALLAAVASGACNALATLLAAVWYPAWGGSVFFAMAGIAALGGVGAIWLSRLRPPAVAGDGQATAG